MRIARVFPRRTTASPDDPLAFFGPPPSDTGDFDEIRVSVSFSYDLKKAEELAAAWKSRGPVEVGGPATGMRGEQFEVGMYLRKGYTITSRGCDNRCWFCRVWRNDGAVRELEIKDGYILQDDNILATSRAHFKKVCAMLARQPLRAEFPGGLEARRLTKWHVRQLAKLRPSTMFFSYDTPDDYEPLVEASKLLRAEWHNENDDHRWRCYVLCGQPKDTFEKAEKRMTEVVRLGLFPHAMLWKDRRGNVDVAWRRFARLWVRGPAVGAKYRTLHGVRNKLIDILGHEGLDQAMRVLLCYVLAPRGCWSDSKIATACRILRRDGEPAAVRVRKIRALLVSRGLLERATGGVERYRVRRSPATAEQLAALGVADNTV